MNLFVSQYYRISVETSIFNPNQINEFLYGINRYVNTFYTTTNTFSSLDNCSNFKLFNCYLISENFSYTPMYI